MIVGSGVKIGDFTKDSPVYEVNKEFAGRLTEIIGIVKVAQPEEFINQYIIGDILHEIEAILQRLNVEKSVITEIVIILSQVERINKAVHNIFWNLSSDQDVDSALHDMLRHHDIDHELKQYILKTISDLHVGDGVSLQRSL